MEFLLIVSFSLWLLLSLIGLSLWPGWLRRSPSVSGPRARRSIGGAATRFTPSACSSPPQFRRGNPLWSGAFLSPTRAYLVHGARVAGRFQFAGDAIFKPRGLGRRSPDQAVFTSFVAARFAVAVPSAPLLRVGGSLLAPAPSKSHVAASPATAASASQSSAPGLAGRREPIRYLGFYFVSVAPVAFSACGLERVVAGLRGVSRVPEPVGAPRVIFKVLWQSLLGADDGGVQSTLRVRPPS
ncbi:hypothetical protein NDU88_005090 [Pleurodeles waltl]|uniref:Uncharacterized protein n=1 Tax=Pleurodeles waltl TaxID=8319 RepID=A0AAV7PHK4_PLEWA|nr:hypothetical protein NDU88_005090 [Pleurodeles waltl]